MGGGRGGGDLQCGNYVDSRREREQKKKKSLKGTNGFPNSLFGRGS